MDKLQELQVTGNAISHRVREYEALPAAQDAFRKSVVRFRKFLDAHAAGDEEYAHISAGDAAKVWGLPWFLAWPASLC